jgi:hypothetical protein
MILCYRSACSKIQGRMWYETCHMHLIAAGKPVGRQSPTHRHTSTMLTHIASHVAKKWKEVFLATGVVSSNFHIITSHHNLYVFDARRTAATCFYVSQKIWNRIMHIYLHSFKYLKAGNKVIRYNYRKSNLMKVKFKRKRCCTYLVFYPCNQR